MYTHEPLNPDGEPAVALGVELQAFVEMLRRLGPEDLTAVARAIDASHQTAADEVVAWEDLMRVDEALRLQGRSRLAARAAHEAVADRLLMGPGPSNPYPEVTAAFAQPLLGHLDPEFLRILDETCDRLRTVFDTTNALTLPISGTGSAGMEACFVNLVEPGDTVIV